MYERILVAVDGSETSKRGLGEAVRLAKLTGGRLLLVHAIDDVSFAAAMGAYGMDLSGAVAGDWLADLREGGRAILREAEATAGAASVPAETVLGEGFAGPVWEQLCKEAENWKADLIVLGTHGRRGVGRALLGSTAEMVARHATVPVLLVRSAQAG
ncbi:universal stress protein [Ramlibacter sp. WS9]|uniref:universal stress protein n=1 Tax=Ramlibacter sp. WS9 TaxID=1882741 RepID=UPI001143B87C|nr:universal stress protein [Ramlibacter sp. WS9]ROZ75419.1 universal stress protein [Ramlibacter sp. WS9]